jgi:cadmium resistance protein CadD (predicted permease)
MLLILLNFLNFAVGVGWLGLIPISLGFLEHLEWSSLKSERAPILVEAGVHENRRAM